MIKSQEHAQAVQKRRHESGKRGYAKAVRRFMRRSGDSYTAMKAGLPVRW